MHSGTHIKVANHQAPIDLDKFRVGGQAVLTVTGKAIHENKRTLEVTSIDKKEGFLVASGTKFMAYLGSLQSHNGELGVLEAA